MAKFCEEHFLANNGCTRGEERCKFSHKGENPFPDHYTEMYKATGDMDSAMNIVDIIADLDANPRYGTLLRSQFPEASCVEDCISQLRGIRELRKYLHSSGAFSSGSFYGSTILSELRKEGAHTAKVEKLCAGKSNEEVVEIVEKMHQKKQARRGSGISSSVLDLLEDIL